MVEKSAPIEGAASPQVTAGRCQARRTGGREAFGTAPENLGARERRPTEKPKGPSGVGHRLDVLPMSVEELVETRDGLAAVERPLAGAE